jgi:large subunit ribosomal protein L12
MQEVYAALMLHDAKQPITEESLKKVLSSIGSAVDDAKIKALVASLEGVNIDEAIKQAVVAAEEDESKKAEEASAGLSALFG